MWYKGQSDYIKKYSTYTNFNDLKEFNRHMEMFLAVHKRDFTKSEFIAFRRLTKYASKVFGVATVSIGVFLRAIQRCDRVGVSESTFHRMKRKAIRQGILKVVEQRSATKKQTTNIWIFQKFQTNAVKSDTPKFPASGKEIAPERKWQKGKHCIGSLTPLKAVNPNKASDLNNREARIGKKEEKRMKRKSAVPEALNAILSAYFDDARYIGEFWRMAQYYVRKSGKFVDKEELLGLAMTSFGAIKKYVKKASAKKPIALYNTVLERNLMALLERKQEAAPATMRCFEEECDREVLKTKLALRLKENAFLLRVHSKVGTSS